MTSLIIAIALAFAQPGSSYQLPTMTEVPHDHERIPPLTVSSPEGRPDRTPVMLGAGIVVLAGLFWWNARRRARIDHEEDSDDR
jgi:hypothetical protein